MTCTHDLAEKETAVGWDGLCPICLQAQRDTLLAALRGAKSLLAPLSVKTAGQHPILDSAADAYSLIVAAISEVEGEKT